MMAPKECVQRMHDQNENNLPLAFATDIVRTLVHHGHRALFAGGCVRDRLLGKSPEDYDVATSARPDEVARLFPQTVLVGAAFGVVRVLGPRRQEKESHLEVEVATFRNESGYSDGRHPDAVRFSHEIDDVGRRDFTINGLLFDPLTGQLIDHVGGQGDLDQRILRAIGDPRARFAEDHLRLMRAVRFAANLDFKLETATLEALIEQAAAVRTVSAERIRDECSKMLTGPRPRAALEGLKRTGLLKYVLPEVDALEGVRQPERFHPEGDVWVHTLLLLENLSHAPLALALAALLHDIGKPATQSFDADGRIRFNGHDRLGAEMTETLLRRLRFPNETIRLVRELVSRHMVFKDTPRMRKAKLKRFLRAPNFDAHLELHRLDCLACHGHLDSYNHCAGLLKALAEEPLRPPPLIDGHALIAMGLEPGPLFGRLLTEVEDLQLEGSLFTREEAQAFVRHRMETERKLDRKDQSDHARNGLEESTRHDAH